MVKEQVLDFANHINRTKRGTKGAITETDPEYRILDRLYRTKWPIWECSLNYASALSGDKGKNQKKTQKPEA